MEFMASYIAVALLALLVAQLFYVRAQLSQQKRIQQELRASEAKFSGILSIAADAIITFDSTARIVHFNRGAEDIFGYSSHDAVGRHLAVLLPPRFRGAHSESMEMFARSPSTSRRMGERREIFGLRSNGSEFPAEASISKLVSPDGILFTVVLRDITRQKNAEADERFLGLAASEFAATLAVETTLQAMVDLPIPRLADAAMIDLISPRGQFRCIVSQRQRAELTPALEALVTRTLTFDSPSPVIDVMRRNRLANVDVADDEWLEANADLEDMPLWRALGTHARLILPLHIAGETIGALTLIRTDGRIFEPDRQAVAEKYLKSAAAALANAQLYDVARHANQARDEVLGIVSHDLRNPISAITMCVRGLSDLPAGDETGRREMLQTISQSAAWMNRLIADLLDVANIERGQLALERRAQEPTELVLQALHMFDLEARADGISLKADIPTNLPLATVDGTRIVQVLGNLLRNAINFTPERGTITLAVENGINELCFSVADSGPGIKSENVEHIFDRYWQSSTAARTKGSGLGLSIAKGIVEAHGGRIWVDSVPGAGSRFCFTIPVAAVAALPRLT
jgi:PAS domain S-box-containing protein